MTDSPWLYCHVFFLIQFTIVCVCEHTYTHKIIHTHAKFGQLWLIMVNIYFINRHLFAGHKKSDKEVSHVKNINKEY